MENNKPVTTDPSEESEMTLEDQMRQRIRDNVETQRKSDEALKLEDEQGGSSDVTNHADTSTEQAEPSVLSLVEASTGRKFGSLEEAKKFLSNLNSLVGDQAVAKAREAAKKYEDLVAAADKLGKSPEDIQKLVADSIIDATQTPTPVKKVAKVNTEVTDDELTDRVAKLEDANQKLALLNKYSYAQEVQDEIAIIAKAKGLSYVEAFEKSPFKDVLAQKAEDASKKSPVVTPSTRTTIDTKKLQELGKKALSYGATGTDKQKLVEEYLGLK